MRLQPNIEKIYDLYSKELYFTSLRITGESFDAEEIMQETIIKYYNYPDKSSIENLRGWLKSVCIRRSLDKLRERHRKKVFLEEYKEVNLESAGAVGEVAGDIGGGAEEVEYSVEKIKKALSSLQDNYRVILSLMLFEGYDYGEASQITGVKESTIRSTYLRAKNKLATVLKSV